MVADPPPQPFEKERRTFEFKNATVFDLPSANREDMREVATSQSKPMRHAQTRLLRLRLFVLVPAEPDKVASTLGKAAEFLQQILAGRGRGYPEPELRCGVAGDDRGDVVARQVSDKQRSQCREEQQLVSNA